jgi:hypothetical protein
MRTFKGKEMIMVLNGSLIDYNETNEDLMVYFDWDDKRWPIYVSYKTYGDVARFKSVEEFKTWLFEHLPINI